MSVHRTVSPLFWTNSIHRSITDGFRYVDEIN